MCVSAGKILIFSLGKTLKLDTNFIANCTPEEPIFVDIYLCVCPCPCPKMNERARTCEMNPKKGENDNDDYNTQFIKNDWTL